MEILKKFETLKASNKFFDEGFLSVAIDNDSIFRIALDKDYNPTILIAEESFNKKGWSDNNFRLEKLELSFDIECDIKDLNSNKELKKKFTIIKQVNGNSRMHDYFLRVMEGILNELMHDLSANRLKNEIEYLVRLFSAPKRTDQKTVVGLWGELAYILDSQDIAQAISAWHVDTFNTFDFSFEDYNLEVKTTTTGSRVHEFNNNQLKKYKRLKVIICSIITENTALGKSIQDLWDEINQRCQEPILRSKVSSIIAETIKQDLEALTQFRFNLNLGLSSMQRYNSMDLPVIADEHIEPGIESIKIRVNLDSVLPINS